MYGSDTDDNSESQKESSSKRSLPFPNPPKTEHVKNVPEEISSSSTFAAPAAPGSAPKRSGSKPEVASSAKSTDDQSGPQPSTSNKFIKEKKPTVEVQVPEKSALSSGTKGLTTALKSTSGASVSRQKPQENVSKTSQDADHLSISCHLFPRLSESNLQFHDIYWNFDRQAQTAIIRKRVVKVTKMLKIVSIKREKHQPASTSQEFLAEFYLVDCRPQANQQIVSNVHTVGLPTQSGRLTGKSSSRPVTLIRSNYAQPEVELRLVLKQQSSGAEVGSVQLTLLDGQAKQCLASKSQTHLFGDIRLTLDVYDVPARLVPQVDCLPDVLICDESWIPMLATFRQLTCERLAYMESCPQSTWILDPVVTTFPKMLSNKNLVDIFIALLAKQKNAVNSATFRSLYMDYMIPLLDEHTTEAKDRLIETFLGIEKGQLDALTIMTSKLCTPLNIYEYSVQLCGKHALD